MYASNTQAKQSLQYDKKTVYMFSNIFVLYYIQLSLLKWNTEEYYIVEQKQRLTIHCAVSPAGLWHDVQRLSLS